MRRESISPVIEDPKKRFKCDVEVVDHENLDSLQEYHTHRRVGMMTKSTFYDMDSAVTVSSNNGNMPIISSDKKSATVGAKDFRVQCYDGFIKEYAAMWPEDRHHYETIFGKCHIYVDLEFSKPENAGLDGRKVTSLFCGLLYRFLCEEIGAEEDGIQCVCMDSSSASKFSAHLVVRLCGCCWLNNFHVGAFMRRFQVYTLDSGYTREASDLWAWKSGESSFSDPDEKDFVADMAVYTTRRQFRMCYSSKSGQKRYLVPVVPEVDEGGVTVQRGLDDVSLDRASVPFDRDYFMTTIVQCTEPTRVVLRITEVNGADPRSTSNKYKHLGAHAPKKIAGLTDTSNGKIRSFITGPVSIGTRVSDSGLTGADVLKGSELPEVALRVVAWIERAHGASAYIPTLLLGSAMKLYVPVRDKYCEIAKRVHKNNHTKYVVSLDRGTYSKSCMDPDCYMFKAWTKKLPDDLSEESRAYADKYTKDRRVDMTLFWGGAIDATAGVIMNGHGNALCQKPR